MTSARVVGVSGALGGAAASGSQMVTVVPCPGVLSTSTCPPGCWTVP